MAPFQPLKRVRTNMQPRGPAPHIPQPAYGRLKAVPGTQSNGDGTPPATAPICPANVYSQPVYSPIHLQQPPLPVVAPTLPSITNVLNQVVNIINQYITYPPFQPGNGYIPPGLPGQVGGGSGPLYILGNNHGAAKNAAAVNNGSTTVKGRWIEVDRQTEDVRVENPDDSDQYVIVKRINSLTMRDTGTGEIWRWDRQSGAGFSGG